MTQLRDLDNTLRRIEDLEAQYGLDFPFIPLLPEPPADLVEPVEEPPFPDPLFQDEEPIPYPPVRTDEPRAKSFTIDIILPKNVILEV